VSPEALEQVFKRAQSADRLKIVLDLVATALAHERFAAAASAFVTELATPSGAIGSGFGVVQGRGITGRVLSHSAHFTVRSSLCRLIEAAMDYVKLR
jgi:hypothetical protein